MWYSKNKKKPNKAQDKDPGPPVDIDNLVDLAALEEKMDREIESLFSSLASFNVGRANPSILSKISVSLSNSHDKVFLNKLADITIKDAQTLLVIPFEDESLKDIERAIRNVDLGLNPVKENNILKVLIPRQSNEAREKASKELKRLAEIVKVKIRKHRQNENKLLKSNSKANVPKDDVKFWEEQAVADHFISKVSSAVDAKLTELEKR
ncbi:hypothetical protein BB560_001203 [Smittium megazygosporum]|uniref:Ribosome recycling factor domain-containing protein n=1 Tax=Smittium megazygosporum TaxID=133381 RepID=A0A2T9ZI76_9FUNG|nr:hypothetical protein BB560_001203 [Smittium megazygosporum]